jgi:hypothetical protein
VGKVLAPNFSIKMLLRLKGSGMEAKFGSKYIIQNFRLTQD